MLGELYNFFFMSYMCLIMYSMLYMCSPLFLAGMFILSVCTGTYYFTMYVSTFMSYMLFLVYVGGLLVLLIYMIMVSLNHIPTYSFMDLFFLFVMGALSFSLLLLFSHPNVSLKPFSGSESLLLSVSSLVILGTILLYVFLNVCTSVIIGGRTLTFGT